MSVSQKKIVLGVAGGIAAYKAAELCRLLKKAGAEVRVVLTEAGATFVGPLTFQALSGHPVGQNLSDAQQEAQIGHIQLADEADLVVVAPATADVIARFAAGMANDLLSAVVLATRAPVLLAPAMNVNMWSNPLTQGNLGRLLASGRFHSVGPDRGELACGWVGEGRLVEPPYILAAADKLLTGGSLEGRRVVVTAGPTYEAIDDVRFVGNRSSGRMGFALAAEAASRGAEVVLIAGPVALATPRGVVRVDVESAAEMGEALVQATRVVDVVVMAAAVADFRPAERVTGKLSRRASDGAALSLSLVANPDLLAEVGAARAGRAGTEGREPFLVGFAAEKDVSPEELVARAERKRKEKGCDLVVANDVGTEGAGFGSLRNAVTVVGEDLARVLPLMPKDQLAVQLWDLITDRMAARTHAPGNGPSRSSEVVRA